METRTVHCWMTGTAAGRWRRQVIAEINAMEASGWAVRQILSQIPETMIVVYERAVNDGG